MRVALAVALLPLVAACSAPPKTWVVFYGAQSPPELLAPHDVVVVDPGYRGDLSALKARGATVLAYLSLGEVATTRSHHAEAKAAGVLVQANPNWPDAWMVDIRKPAWRALVVDRIAPRLLARGFDGLFLDTIDSALHLERTRGLKGATEAAVGLIRALHQRHPKARLLLNGGLPLVGALRGAVDWVAVESTFTTWDFKARRSALLSAAARAAALARLRKAREANPDLVVFTLDYTDPTDTAAVKRIYAAQRAAGFVPYVATIGLNVVVPEPGE